MFDINNNIPMWMSLVFMGGGLALLSWSADRFVDGAAKVARAFGVSPLIVGMVIIGFGTSAPELAVSVLSGVTGHSNLSLGNAYGSCIFNIAVILGVAALIRPIVVKPSVCFVGMPLLLAVTGLSYWLVEDMEFQRSNGVTLLVAFALIMPAYCLYDQSAKGRKSGGGTEPAARPKAGIPDFFWLVAGLVLLVVSSHLLVWGCVDFARDVLHVSDLLIGLTVVAAGTSLPELASAIASARRGEHEFVIGNIVGSNLFNTLAVVGLAGTISPFSGYSPYVVTRDLPLMGALTLSIGLFGLRWRHPRGKGRVNRAEGAFWILVFTGYTVLMIIQETAK